MKADGQNIDEEMKALKRPASGNRSLSRTNSMKDMIKSTFGAKPVKEISKEDNCILHVTIKDLFVIKQSMQSISSQNLLMK